MNDLWTDLLRHAPLGILTDLDGTILPFALTPDSARPSAELRALLEELATLPGVTHFLVTGRPHVTLDDFFPPPGPTLFVAEHGAWRSVDEASGRKWEPMISLDRAALDSLAAALTPLFARYPAALLERKTWGFALHFRRVSLHRKAELLVEASAVLGPWLDAHIDFERLEGAEVVEIRPRASHKGSAVAWARERLGADCRLLILGDDVTDEDMFAVSGDEDASVLVASGLPRATRARWQLPTVEATLTFLRALIDSRRRGAPVPPAVLPVARPRRDSIADTSYHLLVLSNRLPELRSAESSLDQRKQRVGGLVSALEPVLSSRKGIWLGWSGHTRADANPSEPHVEISQGPQSLALAWVDFPEEMQRRYYNGVANGAIWPLFHSFPGRVHFSHTDWQSYERANEAFATAATKLVGEDDTIWVHDYHLLLIGKYLRARGHGGPVGFFNHIPFPGPDIFFLLPWAGEVLDAALSFDLAGFHTRGFADNFLRCMASLPGVRIEGAKVIQGDRSVTVGVFPLGIIPAEFQDPGGEEASDEIAGLTRAIGTRRLVLGVDRLDYTKGIPERIDAFGHLLATFPEWRKNVSFVQVSVPSRADIPEYAEQRARIEQSVGRINGEMGEADWVPIRYLYRSYGRSQLSQLYRLADVGYVTPLRDGMNLVAKEYIAAQDPERPGVLLLSRFAGAADELSAALLTNPWDPEGTARDLDRALRMPLAERLTRHTALLDVISKTTALTWAQDFLAALDATRAPRHA